MRLAFPRRDGAFGGQLVLLLTAVQFLTRLPVPGWVGHGPGQAAHAARYYPLVGMGVGLVGAGVFAGAGAGLPPLVAAVLSVAATVLLTGALHEDGLSDTLDGLFGGTTRVDALRIMRDSAIGAYGAAGLVVALGLKAAVLAELPDAGWALVAGHAGSRAAMVAVIAALPYARADGKAAGVAGVGMREVAVAGLVGAAALLPFGWRGVAMAALAAGVAWAMARWFRRRLGGYTGDTLGAVQQVAELAILLGALWRAA